jgi:hypothetical protein
MKKLILISGFCILFLALGLRAYFSFTPTPPPTLEAPLSSIVPDTLPGWTIQDQDLAESPESAARVSSFLNFDDALFRVFKRGDTFVGLYIAYWSPGKASYRWAGAHTPDTCWVQSGWTCSAREYSIPFMEEAYDFQPAEFGIYEKDGQDQKVYFWHLIGGQAFSYKQEGVPNIFGALIDLKEYGLNLRQEQFFIRLSSNEDLASLRKIAGFNEILDSLAEITQVASQASFQSN